MSLWGQAAWTLCHLCPSDPLSHASQPDGPPDPRYTCGAVGNSLDAGSSGGGSLQLEKSIGVRPGGGGTYPDIPAAVVLGEVVPPEEAVALYPGD